MLENEFNSSAVWVLIGQVEDQLKAFSEVNKDDPKFTDVDRKLEYLRWVLVTSDTALISENEISASQKDLQNIVNHLPNNANNWAHYATISNSFASIFGRFPYPRLKRIFRSDANEKIEEFIQQIDALKKDFTETTSEAKIQIEAIKSELDSYEPRSQELLRKLGEYEHKIELTEQTLEANVGAATTAKLSEVEAEFSQTQAERSQEFQNLKNQISGSLAEVNTQLKQFQEEHSKVIRTVQLELTEQKKHQEESARETLKKLEGFYELAGQTALSGGFVEAALQEYKAYTRYSISATILMLAAALFIGYSWVSLSGTESFEISSLLMRIPVSVVLLIPGFYLAALASRARRASLSLRSLGLRIKAFDAYAVGWSSSEEIDHQEIKMKMAEVFFQEKSDKDRGGGIYIGSGGKLVDVLEKIVDKIPGVGN